MNSKLRFLLLFGIFLQLGFGCNCLVGFYSKPVKIRRSHYKDYGMQLVY
jgi:hypothetical protein